MKSKEEIVALLVALGSTKEEVAAKLVSLGIKGGYYCSTCPIAQYLISNGVKADIAVDGTARDELQLGSADNYVREYSIDTYSINTYPKLIGVLDFVQAFDRGEYPECENPSISHYG
jgi:hypothetical protein